MIHIWFAIWHWLREVLGVNIGIPGHTPRWYNGESGSGSDIQELAIIGFIIGLYHHHNCPVPRCPRLTHKKFPVKGTPLYTCHHHATPRWHMLLLKQYKEDYPQQHKMLNKGK